MKVAVAGLGALGGRLAAELLLAGIPVRGFQRPGPTESSLRARGLSYRDRNGRGHRLPLEVASDPEALAADPPDLCLVTVKAHQTRRAAEGIARFLAPRGVALTLQNGLGNAEILAEALGASRVALGTCTCGAHRREGEVIWGGDGEILFGPWEGNAPLAPVEALLRSAGMRARRVEDPKRTLWEKVVLNGAVNPVSALLGRPNGTLGETLPSRQVMATLLREALEVARAEGFDLEEREMGDRVRRVLEATGPNRSSMLQDREAGRRTETDALGGALIERGRRHGLELPVTEALHRLLAALDGDPERKD